MNDPQIQAAIDAFLDGRLGRAEHQAFAERMAGDDSLRRAVELAQQIDRAVRRLHQPCIASVPRPAGTDIGSGEVAVTVASAANGLGRSVDVASSRDTDRAAGGAGDLRAPVHLGVGMWTQREKASTRRGWRMVAFGAVSMAAALVITGTALVAAPRWRLARDRAQVAAAPATPVEVYRAMARKGFAFEWSCADEAEFIDYTQNQFGQGFLLAQTPGLEVLGWAYPSAVLGSPTGVLLARRDGVPSVLLVVPREVERPQATGAVDDLHVHRREVGGLAVYEVSSRSDSDLLARVVCAEPAQKAADGP